LIVSLEVPVHDIYVCPLVAHLAAQHTENIFYSIEYQIQDTVGVQLVKEKNLFEE